MKNLFKSLLFTLSLLASVFVSHAQDVQVELSPFTLSIPDVSQLTVRPLGALIKTMSPEDSTVFVYTQNIYYELKTTDGRVVEAKNKVVPEAIADLLVKYQKGTTTPTDRAYINGFLQVLNSSMALKPEEE